MWFVGGTPDVVAGVYLGYDQPRSLGGYAQGGRIAAPIFKQFAKAAFASLPKIPFVAPPGIRWVRIDRASGKRVFGTFPTEEDPKSPVIWEAFQPQTEPRRSFRRGQGRSERDDDAEDEDGKGAKTVKVVRRVRAAPRRAPPTVQPAPTNPLPTQPPTQ